MRRTHVAFLPFLSFAIVAARAAASPVASGGSPQAAVPAAVRALSVQPNVFLSRRYQLSPLPTFANSRAGLSQPVAADHPEWVRLYWKAWELAFQHLKQPEPASGFVSNFIDPAFNANTFQWDSCFMVLFARYAQPRFRAIDSFDNFYAKQHPDGYICREISRSSGQDVYFNGVVNSVNPPLFSWVEWQNYLLTGDKGRFRNVLPPLIKHYLWLRSHYRRPNGLYWNTGLGAGEDDLVRSRRAYSYVDMTAQQAQNAYYIARIAQAIGNRPVAAWFDRENKVLSGLVTRTMWDPKSRFFYDLDTDGAPTGIKTALGFWPLLAHMASPPQARALTTHLRDPHEFWREDVVPALAADEPGYSAEGQYWNGAVWAPTNYMVVKGLQDYGYEDLASRVTAKYLANMAAVLSTSGTIWENYAPEHPAGHGVRDMVGWSGDGPIALLIENVLGVRAQAATQSAVWRPRLPGENGLRNLTVGSAHLSLIASPVRGGQRTLILTTDRPFTVTVDAGRGRPHVFRLRPGMTVRKVPASGMDMNYRTYDAPQVRIMKTFTVGQGDLALGRPATASSQQGDDLGPRRALDGDSSTRWSSSGPMPQWLTVDLGASHLITGITLHWETANAAAYQLQVSGDGQTWKTIYRTIHGRGRTEALTTEALAPFSRGRYVRLYITANNGINDNVSLYEIEVRGKSGAQ